MERVFARSRDGGHRLFIRSICLIAIVLLPALANAAGMTRHEFTYDSSGMQKQPAQMHIAGDFNGWSKDATPMKRVKGNVWSVTLELADGVYHYKFVGDTDTWITDPKGDKAYEIDDTFGGRNSGVLIGFDIRKLPPAQDDSIHMEAVKFDPNDVTDCNVVDEHTLRLSIRAQAGDVKDASVVFDLGHGKTDVKPMPLIESDKGLDRFATVVHVDQSPAHLWIKLHDGKAIVDAGSSTQLRKVGLDNAASTSMKIEMKPSVTPPQWAQHAIWYQIFPERFRNGDKANDPGDKPDEKLIKWTSNWWKAQPGETPGDENFYKGAGNVWKRRYGGDIQGVQQELPYLRSLGVNAIYFCPIFEAESMHKYDATDYVHIDDNFGAREQVPLDGETEDPSTWKWSKSDKIFLDFVADAHKQGFKVVVDGVFNHVGKANPLFQDVLKNGKKSKYADWFEITDWGNKVPADPELLNKPGGLKYKAWDDGGALPVFKKDDKLGLVHGPREYVLAVCKRWLAPDGDASKGVDGFRLDVPGDIPHPFWIDWHKMVKTTKPDAYISGEIWSWAQPWINKGDQFDAVMNYQFAMAVQDNFVNQKYGLAPSVFAPRCVDLQMNYPQQSAAVMMNLFDSHDTDRAASMYVNPDVPYDAKNRIQDNGPDYSPRKPNDEEWARMRQAVAFQMTFLGAPMIYYGDEAGMWSPDDPSNRMPMVWKDLEPFEDPQVKFDQVQFNHYQRAIAVRAALPELQTGFFRPILTDDEHHTFGFARDLNGKTVYVIQNKSNSAQSVEVPLPADAPAMVDWMDAANVDVKQPEGTDARPAAMLKADAKPVKPNGGKLSIQLKPYGTIVLAPAK